MKAKKVQFAFGETLLIDSLQKAEVSEMTWLSITKIAKCLLSSRIAADL
jgi:hypothetical protein